MENVGIKCREIITEKYIKNNKTKPKVRQLISYIVLNKNPDESNEGVDFGDCCPAEDAIECIEKHIKVNEKFSIK